MNDTAIQSTLLVFGVIFCLAAYVTFYGLRTRLASVPNQAAILQQQIAVLTAETGSAQMVLLRVEEELERLRQDIDRTKTRLLEARQMQHEAQNRLPTVIYVLDQIIQSSYLPWVTSVRWDHPPKGIMAATAEELRRGRRVLVFADSAANVRRRIEARFPPGQGYHMGEPAPFEY
jgi:hypothetical protein